jgi:hypothetical protein
MLLDQYKKKSEPVRTFAEDRLDWGEDKDETIYLLNHERISHTCIHTCMHTCIHRKLKKFQHTYIHTYMHTYMHTYIHTYMHAYTGS